MRLPWEQLAMEVIEVSAPELGDKLYSDMEPDLAEAAAGWGIVHLVKWALARCPDHLPPSASDLVPGPTAARQVARAGRWRGSPEVYVAALAALPDPIIELRPEGIRLRGLQRYDAAWGDRNEAAWKAYKAAHPDKYPTSSAEPRRKSAGAPTGSRPSDPDADADPDAERDAQQLPPNPPLSQEGGEGTRRPRRARQRHLQPVPPPPPPPTPAQEAYGKRLGLMREGGATYAATQLERLTPELVDGRLVLHAPDPFFADFVAEHYLAMLRDANAQLVGATGPPIELRSPPKTTTGATA